MGNSLPSSIGAATQSVSNATSSGNNQGVNNELAAIYQDQNNSTIQQLQFQDEMNQDQVAFSETQQYMAFNQSRAASIGNFVADTYNEMRGITNKEMGAVTQN